MHKIMSGSLKAVCLSLTLGLVLNMPGGCKTTPWDNCMKEGRQQLESGSYAEAGNSLQEALNLSRTFQADDPRLGATIHTLANLYLKEEDFSLAKQYFERALELEQKALGADSLEVADALYGLAACCEQKGDPMAADIFLRRVAEIWTSKLGANSPRLVSILPDLATYASLNGDLQRSEDLYRQLVSSQERTYGSNNPKLATSLNLLASTLANRGKYSEAEEIARRAVNLVGTTPEQSIVSDSARSSLNYIRQQLGQPPLPESSPTDRGLRQVAPIPIKPGSMTPPPQTSDPGTTSRQEPTQPTSTGSALTISPKSPLAGETPGDTKTKSAHLPAGTALTTPASGQGQPPSSTTTATLTSSPSNFKAKELASAAGASQQGPRQSTGTNGTSAHTPVTGKEAPIVAASQPGKAGESTLVETQHILRAPNSPAVTTTSDEFRPWELKNQTQDDVSDPQKGGQRQTAWGKIRYLAGGRLISQEEYQAMLLANEAYEMIRTARYQMAVTILKKALATYPNLASAHTNIGLALSRLGEITQAEDHLKEAIAIDPARSAPWINLASCFQLNGQLRESVATYREYLRRFPSELLAAKARDLVKHLQEECVHQTAVEKALSTAKESGKNDYFQYATYGGATRWGSDHKPIKVYISSGSGIPDFKPEYAGLFKDSFKQWSSACQDVIAFELVNSADKSDIDCQWTNDTSKVSTPTEGGETRISSASTKGIQHATITVLTCDPSPDSPLSQNQVRAVCLHEIGHALGLVGHSPRPQDIMYCSIPPADAKVALSPRDVSTLQRLYSSEATIGLKTWLPGGTTSSKSQALLKRMTDIATNRRNLTSLRQAGNDAAAKGG